MSSVSLSKDLEHLNLPAMLFIYFGMEGWHSAKIFQLEIKL